MVDSLTGPCDAPRPPGRLIAAVKLVVGVIVLALPFELMIWVWLVAKGEALAGDVLVPAGLAFLVGLGPPVGMLIAGATGRRLWPLPKVVVGLTVVAIAVTLFVVRPQAPDGAGRESESDGLERLRQDVEEAFREAEVTGFSLRNWPGSEVCRDWLGRDRNAGQTGFEIERPGGFTLEELGLLRDAFGRAGWVATLESVAFVGGQGRRVQATKDGYSFKTWGTFIDGSEEQDPGADASTPCLRLGSTAGGD